MRNFFLLLFLQIDYGQDLFYDGCGTTKICFGAPSGCERERNCKAVVAVIVRGERYIFEMQGKDARYIAVGLSTDSKMVIFLLYLRIFVFIHKLM